MHGQSVSPLIRGAEADVERVVPDVQLPHVRRVARRDEVDRVRLSDVDDEFVGTDAVEAGHLVVGQLGARTSRPHPECAKPTTAPCAFGPAQNRQGPAGPVLQTRRTGIVLLLQAKQHEVTGMARGKTGDLEVVVHQS